MSAGLLEIYCAENLLAHVVNGGVGAGLLEGQTYLLRACGACDTLYVDDVPLGRAVDGFNFLWQPGFFAGRVEAEAVDVNGRTLGRFQLDVGPAPDKLGHKLFQRMVDELLAFRPELLLGTEPAQSPFDINGPQTNPEIEYARARRYGTLCIDALQMVCNRPLTSLRQDRRIVMPHEARRLDVPAIRALARGPSGAAIKGHNEGAYGKGGCRISVPFAEHTVDNAANRAMAAIVDRFLSRVSGLINCFSSVSVESMNPSAPKVGRRLHILGAMRKALLRVRRSKTLSTVTRAEITAAGLNVISAHPDYARAYQLAWKALRSGIHGDDVSELLPISPTWEIYERWCFLQVTRVLCSLHPNESWRFKFGSGVDDISVQGRVRDVTVEARLQAKFRAWDVTEGSACRSLSAERIPDIVLTTESSRGRRFLILDAKYRASRSNVLDAMQSAHLYRDALLWKRERPWMSLLLIPRRGAAVWLEEEGFQTQFRIGTVELANSEKTHHLERCIYQFLVTA